jgi:hypothetical protein
MPQTLLCESLLIRSRVVRGAYDAPGRVLRPASPQPVPLAVFGGANLGSRSVPALCCPAQPCFQFSPYRLHCASPSRRKSLWAWCSPPLPPPWPVPRPLLPAPCPLLCPRPARPRPLLPPLPSLQCLPSHRAPGPLLALPPLRSQWLCPSGPPLLRLCRRGHLFRGSPKWGRCVVLPHPQALPLCTHNSSSSSSRWAAPPGGPLGQPCGSTSNPRAFRCYRVATTLGQSLLNVSPRPLFRLAARTTDNF